MHGPIVQPERHCLIVIMLVGHLLKANLPAGRLPWLAHAAAGARAQLALGIGGGLEGVHHPPLVVARDLGKVPNVLAHGVAQTDELVIRLDRVRREALLLQVAPAAIELLGAGRDLEAGLEVDVADELRDVRERLGAALALVAWPRAVDASLGARARKARRARRASSFGGCFRLLPARPSRRLQRRGLGRLP